MTYWGAYKELPFSGTVGNMVVLVDMFREGLICFSCGLLISMLLAATFRTGLGQGPALKWSYSN